MRGVFVAEITERFVTDKVFLHGILPYWVSSAPHPVGAVAALGKRLDNGVPDDFFELLSGEHRFVVIAHVAEAKALVAHLGKHTALVAGVDPSGVVVDRA